MSIFDYGFFPTIHNRFICPSHKVIIKDPSFGIGRYHNLDDITLYANFQLLVDYVEIECASMEWHHYKTFWDNLFSYLHKIPGLHWVLPPLRNPLAGLHHLRWEMKQTDCPTQVEGARAAFALYKFWKHERPRRINPWSYVPLVNVSQFINEMKSNGNILPPLTPEERELYDEAQRIEDDYHKEDTKMLTLFIQYRSYFWT